MEGTVNEGKPLLQSEGIIQTDATSVGMPDMFTDGDQGPINQVILSTLGAATDDHGNVIDGSVSGTFVADASTLQNLIASGTVQLTDASGQPLQLVRLTSNEEAQPQTTSVTSAPQLVVKGENLSGVLHADSVDPEARIMTHLDVALPVSSALDYGALSVGSPVIQSFPAGTPVWATRLRDCQKIGDFYRGWVETEVELDIILTLHKQHTQSMWGTRQSPCPNKPATRLMWKSQYVPFDGMPFLNAGSRAIVMECQYGPRRKGSQSRKDEMAPLKADFRQTCPARIYIKKVKKFTEFQINVTTDKKQMKVEMDRAFQAIREKDYKLPTQERYYVQLPTQKAHEFHGDLQEEALKAVISGNPQDDSISRLHPMVAEKIREFVSMGETRLYVIRKQLRKFVEKELFEVSNNVPDKHNLQFFPTVNDLQNHIHQAAKDVESGMLPITTNTLNFDTVDTSQVHERVWQVSGNPHAETVTVTITQGAEGEGHVISKVETHLSDGSTQVTENLNPETARLLAKVHPNMFSSITRNLEESSTIRLQMPVSTPVSGDSVPLPMQSEAPLLPPQVSSHQQSPDVNNTLQDTDDQAAAYTVIQGSNGALFLTKATEVLGSEDCHDGSSSNNLIVPESSIGLPTSTVRGDMDHSGVLTIVENSDISAHADSNTALTEVRSLINDEHQQLSEDSHSQNLHHVNNTGVDSLSGECSFTTIAADSTFQPGIQEGVASGDYHIEPSSEELEVNQLTAGTDMLVSEEVGVITQTVDYNIVEVKQESNSIEVVL